ncbi:Prefoldin subunit [Trichinella pseudospiralis]
MISVYHLIWTILHLLLFQKIWMDSKNADKQQVLKIHDFKECSLVELTQAQQQTDADLAFFLDSEQTVKTAHNGLQAAYDALTKSSVQENNKTSLVPMTLSLYVPATLMDTEHYVIDIGAGFYVEMNKDKAMDYYKRKLLLIERQQCQLQEIVEEKRKLKAIIADVLKQRIREAALKPSSNEKK